MTKKVLSLILALSIVCVLFVSCGKETDKNTVEADNEEEIVTPANPEDANPEDVNPDGTQSEDDVEENASLVALRQEISDCDSYIGVAYLGYNQGTFSDVKEYFAEMNLYEAYSFVEDMELDSYFVTGGDDHYLIVPADKEISLKVYKGVMNYETYSVCKGELVGESTDGKPIIVRGNESEIFPNIVIAYGDIEYTPYLSGEDGKLVETYGVHDFSPYKAIYRYFGIEDPDDSDATDPVFCGSWYCEAENGNDELVSMMLNLYVDNTVGYSCDFGNSEPAEYFIGDWAYDAERDMILLSLYGGEVDADFVFVDPYVLECGFKWNMDYTDNGTYLTLVHEEGDPILFGKNGAAFEFVNILEDDYNDNSYLCATWAIISEKKEIYLELFDGGEAHYEVKSDEGNMSLWGYWSAEGLTLYLDLYGDDYGEAEGKAPLYSGEYGIMYDGEMLTLSHFDGDYLTDFMADEGYDSFVFYAVG